MYKRMVAVMTVFFVILNSTAFSDDFFNETNNKNIAAAYIGRGNENLLDHQWGLALDDFHKALSLLDCDPNSRELEFLIHFGKVIACDNLLLKSQCEAELGSLITILSQVEWEDTKDDWDLNNSFDKDHQKGRTILKTLSSLSFSGEVNQTLNSILGESTSVYPSYFQNFYRDSFNETPVVELCKHNHNWNKKIKFLKNVYKWIKRIKEVYDFIKEIKNDQL